MVSIIYSICFVICIVGVPLVLRNVNNRMGVYEILYGLFTAVIPGINIIVSVSVLAYTALVLTEKAYRK